MKPGKVTGELWGLVSRTEWCMYGTDVMKSYVRHSAGYVL